VRYFSHGWSSIGVCAKALPRCERRRWLLSKSLAPVQAQAEEYQRQIDLQLKRGGKLEERIRQLRGELEGAQADAADANRKAEEAAKAHEEAYSAVAAMCVLTHLPCYSSAMSRFW
jgi:chromosome segregation ATPase